MPTKLFKWVSSIVVILLVIFAGLLGLSWLYRDDLVAYVKTIITEQTNGALQIEKADISFLKGVPGIYLTLEGITLHDTAYHSHHTNLLTLRRLEARVSVVNLLAKKIQINQIQLHDGAIQLFTDSTGYSNTSILNTFKPKKKDANTDNSLLDKLEDISIHQVKISVIDSLHHKFFGFKLQDIYHQISKQESIWSIHTKGSWYFDGLYFNTQNGGFLAQKNTKVDFQWQFNPPKQILQLSPSLLEVEGLALQLAGQVDFSDKKQLIINIKTPDVPTQTLLSLLTPKLQTAIGKFKILPKLQANANLLASLEGGQPVVDVVFRTDTFSTTQPYGRFTQLKANGRYCNQLDASKLADDNNSQLHFTAVEGAWEGVPFQSTFTLTNLSTPMALADVRIDAPLRNLNTVFAASPMQFDSGRVQFKFRYIGKITPFLNEKGGNLNGRLNGAMILTNGGMVHQNKIIRLRKMNGWMLFDEKSIRIRKLHIFDQHNLLTVNGYVNQFVPLLALKNQPVRANLDITMPQWDLNWIHSLVTKKTTKKKSGNKVQQQIAETIEKLTNQIEMDVHVATPLLKYRRFVASKVRGGLIVNKRSIRFYDVSMNTWNGKFGFSGGINDLDKATHSLAMKGSVQNADVSKVFQTLDNFGQKTLTHKQLSGKFTTDFSLTATMLQGFRLVTSSCWGDLSVKLQDGALTSFKPFDDFKKIVMLKNRNYDNVQFATIENQLRLRNQEVYVDKMALESSILTLFVEGIYSFRDRTDLSIRIPLMNLKRRDDDYKLLSKQELNDLKGGNIFLRAKDESGKVNIKLDLFKKFYKERARRIDEN